MQCNIAKLPEQQLRGAGELQDLSKDFMDHAKGQGQIGGIVHQVMVSARGFARSIPVVNRFSSMEKLGLSIGL